MNILKVIASIFKPAVKLVDELHTSDEERLKYKAQTLDTYVKAIEVGLQYEQEALDKKAEIIKAEAQSQFKLAAVWRPVTMLGFLAVVMNNYVLVPYLGAFGFEVPAVPIGDEMWQLLQIGIGGYIVSRGAEKIAPSIVESLKKKEQT